MYLQTKTVKRNLKDYQEIADLMKEAFPDNERLPIWWLLLLAKTKNVNFNAFYADGRFCGLTYTLETESVMFLLYFAINEQERSRGYGSQILKQLQAVVAAKEIIINVETPDTAAGNYEQRVRRIIFYERNDFYLCDFMLSIAGIDYTVMSTKKEPNINEIQNIIKKYYIGKLKKNS
ncbi:GNAT family N-acetyltransferase [Phascolarctobacterium sp.]